MSIATFRPQYCQSSLRSIVYVSLFVARWFAAIGAFRSPLLLRLLKMVFPHRSLSTGYCVV